jgi:hypothetical protein
VTSQLAPRCLSKRIRARVPEESKQQPRPLRKAPCDSKQTFSCGKVIQAFTQKLCAARLIRVPVPARLVTGQTLVQTSRRTHQIAYGHLLCNGRSDVTFVLCAAHYRRIVLLVNRFAVLLHQRRSLDHSNTNRQKSKSWAHKPNILRRDRQHVSKNYLLIGIDFICSVILTCCLQQRCWREPPLSFIPRTFLSYFGRSLKTQ